MATIFLTVLICVFNIFMWIIFLKKFKKLFSTEDIIARTREELNRMIEDVNRNTARDLNLADAKIKDLKEVLSDAEKRIAILNSDLARSEASNEFQAALQRSNRLNESRTNENLAVSFANPKAASANISGTSQIQNERMNPETMAEPEHFEQRQADARTDDRSYFSVSRNPAERYAQNQQLGNVQRQPNFQDVEAPKPQQNVMPSVTYSSEPIKSRKDFSREVMDLYAQGLDIEFIATKLGTTTTEVQLIIDMNF